MALLTSLKPRGGRQRRWNCWSSGRRRWGRGEMVYPWGQGAADRGDIFLSKQNLATYTGSPFPFLFIFPPSISMHFIYTYYSLSLSPYIYTYTFHIVHNSKNCQGLDFQTSRLSCWGAGDAEPPSKKQKARDQLLPIRNHLRRCSIGKWKNCHWIETYYVWSDWIRSCSCIQCASCISSLRLISFDLPSKEYSVVLCIVSMEPGAANIWCLTFPHIPHQKRGFSFRSKRRQAWGQNFRLPKWFASPLPMNGKYVEVW